MQALQRVQRSASIGLARVHVTSKAPSQPAIRVGLPVWTGIVRSCARLPPACGSSRLTSRLSARSAAARSARSAPPITRTRPAEA